MLNPETVNVTTSTKYFTGRVQRNLKGTGWASEYFFSYIAKQNLDKRYIIMIKL